MSEIDKISEFLNGLQGQKMAQEALEKQLKAQQIMIDTCKSLGIICPGMTVTVEGQDLLVLLKAHDTAPGFYIVGPALSEEARTQDRLAPLQVLYHHATAEWAKKGTADPQAMMGQLLSTLASSVDTK